MISPNISIFYRYRFQRGFTFIELMVVIGIIGILSSVTLALLNPSRNKGNDATIKADMKTILTQSQLYYGDHGNKYNDGATAIAAGTTCPTGAAVTTMFTDDVRIQAAIANVTSVSGGIVTCYMSASGNAYVVWSPLKTAGTYWCVDGTGIAKQKGAAQTVTDLAC